MTHSLRCQQITTICI